MPTTALEQEFDDECMESVKECRELGYNPSLFVTMRAQMGSVEACRRLMNSPKWLWICAAVGNETAGFVHRGIRAPQSKVQAAIDTPTLDNCEKRLVEAEYI
jgi:hypothetical protein